jgi:tetratricopeptide (TPR) repeat protein
MNFTIILINFLWIFTFHIEPIHLFYHSCKQQNAGNESFRTGKYTDAIEHYTIALSSNVESRPFAAICLCNRAAAYQALGQIADAIADCSLAIALDGNYAKVCLCISTYVIFFLDTV